MPWGVAAAAAGSVISGALSSSATSDASSAAIDQANKVTQEATQWYQPYRTAGETSLNQLSSLLGLNGTDAANSAMSTFTASPGYGYQVSQGLKSVDQGAASKGMLRSGATLQAEQTLGNNLANQDFSNYLNRLYNLTTTGLNATTGLTNAASGQSTNIQSNLLSTGSNQASIYGNTANGVTGAIGTAYKNGLFGTSGNSSTGGLWDSSDGAVTFSGSGTTAFG